MLGVTLISPRSIHAASARVQSFVERKLSGGVRLPCRARIDNRMMGWLRRWASTFACIVPSPPARVGFLRSASARTRSQSWSGRFQAAARNDRHLRAAPPPSRKDVAALAGAHRPYGPDPARAGNDRPIDKSAARTSQSAAAANGSTTSAAAEGEAPSRGQKRKLDATAGSMPSRI
jgi:hypothetical protein